MANTSSLIKKTFTHPTTRLLLTTIAILALATAILFLVATLMTGGPAWLLAIAQLSEVLRFVGMGAGIAGLLYLGFEATLKLSKSAKSSPAIAVESVAVSQPEISAEASSAVAPLAPTMAAAFPQSSTAKAPIPTTPAASSISRSPAIKGQVGFSPSLLHARLAAMAATIGNLAASMQTVATPPRAPLGESHAANRSPAGATSAKSSTHRVTRAASIDADAASDLDPDVIAEQRQELLAAGVDVGEAPATVASNVSRFSTPNRLPRGGAGLWSGSERYTPPSGLTRSSDDESEVDENDYADEIDPDILAEQAAALLKRQQQAAANPAPKRGWFGY